MSNSCIKYLEDLKFEVEKKLKERMFMQTTQSPSSTKPKGSMQQALLNQQQTIAEFRVQLNDAQKKLVEMDQKIQQCMGNSPNAKKDEEIPFFDAVALETQRKIVQQNLLMSNVFLVAEGFNNLSTVSAEFVKKALDIKFQETVSLDPKFQGTVSSDPKFQETASTGENKTERKVIVYPQAQLQLQLSAHKEALNRIAAAVPILYKPVTDTLDEVNRFISIKDKTQERFRDLLTATWNKINLDSHILSEEHKYVNFANSLLPEMRFTYGEINTLKISIVQKKYEYQTQASSVGIQPKEWEEVKKLLEKQQALFAKYHEDATKQQERLEVLLENLISLNDQKIPLTTSFAHNEILHKENQAKWDEMNFVSNKNREGLKNALINQWRLLHAELAEFGLQIDQIGYAVKNKAFSYKSVLTWGLMNMIVGEFAKVEILDVTKLLEKISNP